ncbi:hypothetical protein CERSUDRAFT_24717, partial [Gelatoporia subvermispora B]
LCKEAVVWTYTSHANITPFYGVFRSESGQLWLISKWMANGTVDSYLKIKPSANRLDLVLGISAGLEFLHNMGLIHGDLKSLNILVDEHEAACLADFGLSNVEYADKSQFLPGTSVFAGSKRWMAPELWDPKKFQLPHCRNTKASDVYAFAMV